MVFFLVSEFKMTPRFLLQTFGENLSCIQVNMVICFHLMVFFSWPSGSLVSNNYFKQYFLYILCLSVYQNARVSIVSEYMYLGAQL